MERRNGVRVAANWLWHNAVTSLIPRYAPAVPFLLIRYEDVLTRPVASLTRILAFAGEPDATPPVHDRVANLQPNHTVPGNPGRFSTGAVELCLDEEWQSAMGIAPWCALPAMSLPSIRRYGYTIGAARLGLKVVSPSRCDPSLPVSALSSCHADFAWVIE